MKWIGMFAGMKTAELVQTKLNSLGNVMNIEVNTHYFYGHLAWRIEARDENGTVRISSWNCAVLIYLSYKVKYVYRRLPSSTRAGPGFIRLQDGDEIKFGEGPEASRLGSGPEPLLCNLQLAVARVLKTSGAAEMIMHWMEDGGDSVTSLTSTLLPVIFATS
jgi:hypothetical protein